MRKISVAIMTSVLLMALLLCGCGGGSVSIELPTDASDTAQTAQPMQTEQPVSSQADPIPSDSITEPTPEATSIHAQYYDGDEAALTGTLCCEEFEYKGSVDAAYILVLDEPIDCYVTSYVDYSNNGGDPRWHENVTNVCVWAVEKDISPYVGQHVSVSGTVQGGGKWSAYYTESGEFSQGGGDVMIIYPTVTAI